MKPFRFLPDFPLRASRVVLAALLCLPGLLQAAAPAIHVRVVPGDNIFTIAHHLLARPDQWPVLQKLNRVADPYRLQPGSDLEIPVAMLRPLPLKAKLESVQGAVSGKTGQLEAGAELGSRDEIRTGPDGYAVLLLPDGSRMKIQPDTDARVQQLQRLAGSEIQQSRVEIRQGRIENEVQHQKGPAARYQIQTPTVVIGVRGTAFRAGWDGQRAQVEVTQGVVAANDAALPAGQGAVSSGGKLRTEALLPAPAIDAIPKLFERPLLRIPMPQDGAAAHRLIIASDPGFTKPVVNQLVREAEARVTGLDDGDYHLRLRAVSAEGLEGQDATAAFRLHARPEPPFFSMATDGSKLQGSPLAFSWPAQTTAARYRIRITGAGSAGAPVFAADDLPEPSASVQLAPGDYQWQLASVRADGVAGPWGDVAHFTVKPPQAPPETVVGEQGVAFAWPGEAGQRFEFEMAQDAAFSQIVSQSRTEAPRLELPLPEPGEYFIRVRATDADGFVGQWSAAQKFEIASRRPWWLLGLPLFFFAF